MSGILGVVNLDRAPVDSGLLEQLTASMAYRGPDASATWIDRHVGLGHTLLRACGNTESDRQPYSLDGEIWMVGDARIDARDELRAKLADAGHPASAHAPDVELVLRAYTVWDEQCVERLIGDFTFAIWDRPRERLFCARDQLGVKPFYYACVRNRLVFGNTLDAIRRHPAVSRSLNDLAIADFLVLSRFQEPTATAYADICRLPAAHVLRWTTGRPATRRYWSLPIGTRVRYRRAEEYVERFKEIFGRAVADRLRTDRADILMSGGVDSPYVAAAVKRHRDEPVRSCDLHAHTIVFDRLIPDEERYHAGVVARALELPTHFHAADDFIIYGHWDDRQCCQPEPIEDPQAAVHDAIHASVLGHSRVLLNGLGGDPLFTYLTDVVGLLRTGRFGQILSDIVRSLFQSARRPPIGIRTTLRQLQPNRNEPIPLPPWIHPDLVAELRLRERYSRESSWDIGALHPLRAQAQRSLLNPAFTTMFEHQDAGAIRRPIESRYPFFDLRVIDYVFAIPPVPWSHDKELLRTSIGASLPEEHRRRPKAPLAGDYVAAQCRDRRVRAHLESLARDFRSKYFSDGTFPRRLKPEAEEDVWTSLRPLALAYWLRWNENAPDEPVPPVAVSAVRASPRVG
jgi:asparagine synthase (glutamine-hydrolysing)